MPRSQQRGEQWTRTAMPLPAAIGHLDCDCYSVFAERVRDHFSRGKPVGVLGNQGACVIAKSYEMKRSGVQTGMPIDFFPGVAVVRWTIQGG